MCAIGLCDVVLLEGKSEKETEMAEIKEHVAWHALMQRATE